MGTPRQNINQPRHCLLGFVAVNRVNPSASQAALLGARRVSAPAPLRRSQRDESRSESRGRDRWRLDSYGNKYPARKQNAINCIRETICCVEVLN
jgi:hypothetical protein